ncbi:MCP four helix bundle domain-containing protein [Telluribacter sp. SYSU D00476]|uniref:MCP four helix bundle domain-containing protein n=1 Tax=Telluribacter sp. SYSU D00476 TaxID=2811430 RepID=UPI001FF4B1D0|nr:MCP four helix bundle domain-containing protein [Telluribacter sp. SYSU D00476]
MMKWSFFKQQKIKIVGLLLLVLVIAIYNSLSMERAVQGMDKSMTSVYEDRLQPSVIIVYLTEHLYAKRLLLEDYLTGQTALSTTALESQLKVHDVKSQLLIEQFEKTTLIGFESQWLASLKNSLAAYSQLERALIDSVRNARSDEAIHLFQKKGGLLFRQSIQNLHKLAQLQLETGQAAVKQSHQDVARASILSTLLITIAIVVVIQIQRLVYNARLLDTKSPSFHLN